MLIAGKWSTDETTSPLQNHKGEFVRSEAKLRNWIAADGGTGHPPAAARYHIFLAHNCPWAHRTAICRRLKQLDGVIGVSFADPRRDKEGWWYAEGLDDFQPVNGRLHLHRIYTAAEPRYSGRVTTPVLWDRERGVIVNNESSEILRMLDGAFNAYGNAELNLYPGPLRAEIDAVNEIVYRDVNNGVYRCGFARSQEAYEEAFAALFRTLDELEARLHRHRYLAGDRLTEADIRLFPTLVRFDPVYYSHFKCNLRRIVDYPNLSNYLRDLYQIPAFGETVDVELYKRGYYGNSPRLNPSGIVPLGPELNYDAPHDRATHTYSG